MKKGTPIKAYPLVRSWLVLILVVLLFCQNMTLSYAFGTDSYSSESAKSVQSATGGGWREFIASGVPFLQEASAMRADLANLQSFLEQPGLSLSDSDRRFLENGLLRLRSLATIKEGFADCAAKRGKPLVTLERVLTGAISYARSDCGPENVQVLQNFKNSAQAIVKDHETKNGSKAAEERLRQVSRMRAAQNVARLMSQVQSVDPSQLATDLSKHLSELSRELSRVKNDLNTQSRGLEASVDQKLPEIFEQRSGRYRSLYAAMLSAPNGSIVLTPSLINKIGFIRSAEDIEIKERGRVKGESFVRVDIPNHPTSISAEELSAALKQESQDLRETFRELERDSSMSLETLTLRFPVSVGESLMEMPHEDLVHQIRKLCGIAVAESTRQNMKRILMKVVDLSLGASALVTGLGGVGARAAGREVLAKSLLAGAATSAAAADAVTLAKLGYISNQRDAILELARQNPAISGDPEEMKRVEQSLKEFEEQQKNAILTGATSTVGAIGAFKLARVLTKKADDPVEVLNAAKAKLKTGTDPLDEFVGRLYSNSCAVR